MRYVVMVLSVIMPLTQALEPTGAAQNAFEEMVRAERAFAGRAQETNWKRAFLEYFVDGITGFDGEDIKANLRKQPDPPEGLEFWWEPRYGDSAASGELGWLTGPVLIVPPGAKEKPRFSNYASIWKRQPDGSFKVIFDVGIPVPAMAPFPPGVTRAPMPARYSGAAELDSGKASLLEADRTLTRALQSQQDQASAFAPSMTPFARFHRPGVMPLTERDASLAWLKNQPPWSSGESKFAEAARSGDLGYTWGAYAVASRGERPAETGHYLRVWSRDAQGQWRLVLDVLQPKR